MLQKAEKENPALAEKIKAAQENGGACLRWCTAHACCSAITMTAVHRVQRGQPG